MLRRVLMLCALSAAVAGCGGGGGSNEAFPSRGSFALTGGTLTTTYAPAPATGSATLQAAVLEATATNIDLGGTYVMGDGTSLTIAADKGFTLNPKTDFPPMTITVTSTMQFPSGATATTGALAIQTTDTTSHIHVNLVVKSDGSGVTITQTTPVLDSVGMTWTQFLDINIMGSDPLYQRMAQLAYSSLNFTLSQSAFHARSIQVMQQKDSDLETAGSGKSISIAGWKAPGHSAPGKYDLTWTDSATAPPVGTCGPGDNYSMKMTDYWVESGGPVYTGGTLTFSNYIAETNPTKVGFVDVEYDNVVMQEWMEDSGAYKLDSTITVNGNLGVTFTGN